MPSKRTGQSKSWVQVILALISWLFLNGLQVSYYVATAKGFLARQHTKPVGRVHSVCLFHWPPREFESLQINRFPLPAPTGTVAGRMQMRPKGENVQPPMLSRSRVTLTPRKRSSGIHRCVRRPVQVGLQMVIENTVPPSTSCYRGLVFVLS